MRLTPEERETIILYNEAEDTASVYTHDQKLIQKLKQLHAKFPNKVYPERREHSGAVSYIVPKRCVGIRPPYSEERRKAVNAWAKANEITPPQSKKE